ncbi:MAG: alanine racemase [Syntrophomonadaceae bacterium]|nr:alanine racemase [Syntrophomonadaceae bacterium]MDD3271180.1 alanine racemase [Syntrophomonadaceae bacterium]MDD3897671.1 alanine racemase [Syntrophomonadaceae bacterium]MDD4561693.1 alanine racemase [Syntrophomonadaceae bacterium]
MDNHRPTWAEIDLVAIKHNLTTIKRAAGNAGIMVMVKANAYGHGMLEVSRVCCQEKVDFFGVASLDEALTLKQEIEEIPVLVLGYISPSDAVTVVAEDIRPCIFTMESARVMSQAAVRLNRQVHLHIKLDTGMGRIGFLPENNSLDLLQEIAALPGVKIEGIFTHLAEADLEDSSFSREQIKTFAGFINKLEERGVHIPLKHCSNSAALINFPEAHFDMVRAGILLYGLSPSPQTKLGKFDIIPAMTLKSRVTYVKTLLAGHSISYNRTYYCQRDTRVATVPIGYADGYSRLLSNRVQALINGKLVPLVGNVCMDMCMFDVSGVGEVKEGDEVILFGRPEDGVTADDLAQAMGTINYEVVSALGSRVPRIYKNGRS